MIYLCHFLFLKLTGHASCIIFELHCSGPLLAQRFGYRSCSGHSLRYSKTVMEGNSIDDEINKVAPLLNEGKTISKVKLKMWHHTKNMLVSNL